ncbi:hypothetical protein Q7C36_006429 [Tachysurus vachellii]|uniref:Uncharacterized protein n=1 Tax=Tachysurus vachellii TaxID=175792 RepID=A0AA88NFJ1_TACVA|nr:hypothetical protein Q7C36_006429 [Tachysurus vachellii]
MSPGVKVNLLQAFMQLGVFLEAPKKDDLYNVLWQFLTDTSIPSVVSQDRGGSSSRKVMDLCSMHLLCPPGIEAAMLGQSMAAHGSLVPVSSPPQAERMADHCEVAHCKPGDLLC